MKSGPFPEGTYLPRWDDFEASFRDIFDRRYYTNHGDLAQELERRLEDFFSVRHVILMTNGCIALMLAAKALDLKGKVIVPAFSSVRTVQSLLWAGLEPLYCDVDPSSHMLTPQLVEPLLEDKGITGVLPSHMWGAFCDTEAFAALAERSGVQVYYDATQAFGCSRKGVRSDQLGQLEVFSFHPSSPFTTAEGGCVCVNDDEIAEKLRNLRSSYGRRTPVPISINANGRFSEAQAAMGLLHLRDYPAIAARAKEKFELYERLTGQLSSFHLHKPRLGEESNCHYVVLEVKDTSGVTGDELANLLREENIEVYQPFFQDVHSDQKFGQLYPSLTEFPVTGRLYDTFYQIANGPGIELEEVKRICRVLTTVDNRGKRAR